MREIKIECICIDVPDTLDIMRKNNGSYVIVFRDAN